MIKETVVISPSGELFYMGPQTHEDWAYNKVHDMLEFKKYAEENRSQIVYDWEMKQLAKTFLIYKLGYVILYKYGLHSHVLAPFCAKAGYVYEMTNPQAEKFLIEWDKDCPSNANDNFDIINKIYMT